MNQKEQQGREVGVPLVGRGQAYGIEAGTTEAWLLQVWVADIGRMTGEEVGQGSHMM
jgi:hypothetical protein